MSNKIYVARMPDGTGTAFTTLKRTQEYIKKWAEAQPDTQDFKFRTETWATWTRTEGTRYECSATIVSYAFKG